VLSKIYYWGNTPTRTMAEEGVVRAVIGQKLNDFKNVGTEIIGWFKGVVSKKEQTHNKLDNLIEWLKDSNKEKPNLELEMGSFGTWLKTSETFRWRFYFLLNDTIYNKILKDISLSQTTYLEGLADYEFKNRSDVTRVIDSARNIIDLIKIAKEYQKRADNMFDKLMARNTSVKMAPYQVILLGSVDLDSTLKKVVRLAW